MAVYISIFKKSSLIYLVLSVTTQLKGWFFSDDSRVSSQKSQQLLYFPSIQRNPYF